MITNFEELKNIAIDERCPALVDRKLSYEDLIKILDAVIYEFPDITNSEYIKAGIAMLANIRNLKGCE